MCFFIYIYIFSSRFSPMQFQPMNTVFPKSAKSNPWYTITTTQAILIWTFELTLWKVQLYTENEHLFFHELFSALVIFHNCSKCYCFFIITPKYLLMNSQWNRFEMALKGPEILRRWLVVFKCAQIQHYGEVAGLKNHINSFKQILKSIASLRQFALLCLSLRCNTNCKHFHL